MAATVELDVIAEVRQATQGLRDVQQEVGGLGKDVKDFGKVAAGAFAVKEISAFGKEAIGVAEAARSNVQKTNHLIEQTGAAAWTSSKQVDEMVKSLKDTTATSGSVIREGANLLLTFRNVQNAGEGLDAVFNRANAAAIDLAAVGFGSVEGNAKLLGKALNDPVAGLTALTRAGVTFSEEQKKTIKTLAETGDILGAQKLILAEVERQVGGTAAASVTSSQKMALAWGDTKKAIGEGLLPVLDAALPLVQLLSAVMAENADVIVPVIGAVLALTVGIKAATLVMALFNAVMLANPLVLVALAVIALVAAVALLVKHWDSVTQAARWAWEMFKEYGLYLAGPFGIALKLAMDNFDKIRAAVQRVGDALKWLKDLASSVGGALASIKPWSLPGGGGGGPETSAYALLAGGAGRLGGGITINVTAPLGDDPYRMGDEIVRALARYDSRNGPAYAR